MANEVNLHGVNWNDVKFFIALARFRRLSKAAGHLGTSHVTVANRISSLEETLGLKLFIQNRNGFELTKSGAIFYRHADELENALRLGLEEARVDEHTRPKVRIGVTEGVGDNFLATRVARWLKDQTLDIDFISLPKTTTVTSRRADISITLEKPKGENVILRVLTDYHLGIYASPDYLTEYGPVCQRKELESHPWIGYVDNILFSDELRYHHELSENLNFVFQSTTIRAQMEAAKEGVGLSILPEYMAKNDPGLVRVLPEIAFLRHYWISTNRDLHRFDGLLRAWNFIIDAFAREQSLFMSAATQQAGRL